MATPRNIIKNAVDRVSGGADRDEKRAALHEAEVKRREAHQATMAAFERQREEALEHLAWHAKLEEQSRGFINRRLHLSRVDADATGVFEQAMRGLVDPRLTSFITGLQSERDHINRRRDVGAEPVSVARGEAIAEVLTKAKALILEAVGGDELGVQLDALRAELDATTEANTAERQATAAAAAKVEEARRWLL